MKSGTELDTRHTRPRRATVRRRDRAWVDAAEKDLMRDAEYVSALAAAGRAHRHRTRRGYVRPRAPVACRRTLVEWDFLWPTSAPPSRPGRCLDSEWWPQGRLLILYEPAGTGPIHRVMAVRYCARWRGILQHGGARDGTIIHGRDGGKVPRWATEIGTRRPALDPAAQRCRTVVWLRIGPHRAAGEGRMKTHGELDTMLRRLHWPTIRRLYRERATQAEKEPMGYSAYLESLVAEEMAHRNETRILRAVRRAQFPFLRTIEEFDFRFQSSAPRALLGSYLGAEFLSEGRSLVLYGPAGPGKTHLAIALGYRAIQNGGEASFTTAAQLIEQLSTASRRGQLHEELPRYTRPHVLVIDEVGYLTYGPDAANVLFQVVNERYLHKRAMIFTTNKPIEAWGRVLHDADLAEAILDRVLERGRIIHMRGPSYRTRHLKPALEIARQPSAECAIISGKGVTEFQEPTNLWDDFFFLSRWAAFLIQSNART